MKKVTLFLLVFLAAGGTLWSGTYTGPDSLDTQEKLNEWMSHYYLHRDTASVVPAIRQMFKQGWFEKDTAVAPLAAFWASVFYQNHKQVETWLRGLNDLTFDQKKYLWMAVHLSGVPESQDLLKKIRQENGPETAKFITELLAEERQNVVDMPVTGPAVLDMFWGQFVASGDERCVRRVIAALYYLQETEDLAKMLIGGAARWSLESNAAQHPRVLEICKQARVDLNKAGEREDVKKVLDEIIEKAEKKPERK